MAIEFPHVTADIIEANEFPELCQQYEVSGVPKTIINDRLAFVGAVPEQHFVEAIQQAFEPDTDEPEISGGPPPNA
jgi:predicted DsbA family dithiol-disulfide isomerase